MSARQEKVREALYKVDDDIAAALAEVEEWEAEVAEARGLRDAAYARAEAAEAVAARGDQLLDQAGVALEKAEAEADRLKAALQLIAKPGVQSTNPRHVARAALAPADRNCHNSTPNGLN